jgi:hypothetical protein
MQILNQNQDPDYSLFKYSGDLSNKITPEVRINIEDLVRTGFQDKYNELAQSVIFNIYSKFSNGTSGQQSLVFETNRGEFSISIVGAGVVQGVGIITADSVIYDATVGNNTFTNVEEALDYLLYTPPTITSISGGWSGSLFEVGINPINSNVTVTGNRQVKDIATGGVVLALNPAGPSTSATPVPANQLNVTATLLSTAMSGFIVTTAPITYTLNASVKDVNIPFNGNSVLITSSKSFSLVYPMVIGSSTYNAFTDTLGNVQTTFNSTFMPASVSTNAWPLGGTYPTTGISLPFNRYIASRPLNIDVIHANTRFTQFLFPQAYFTDVTDLLNRFRIQDGSTQLNYPYDTDPSMIGGFQDVSTEWRVRPILLNSGYGYWSGVAYYLVTSKVTKPKLTIRYVFN